MRRWFFYLAVLALAACAGCGRPGVAAAEARERNSALFRKAREAERAGDVRGAIAHYRALLVEEPRAYSAHFQLATLLQDVEQDYVSALYHYQQYLRLRPEAEKATLAQDRIRISEQLLAPQILNKVGDAVEGLTQAHLLKENDRLNRLVARLESEKADLAEQQERAEKARAAAAGEAERLRDILQRMRVVETVERPSAPLPKKSDFETKPVARPDPEALQALRDEAAALAAAAARPPKPEASTAEDLLRSVREKVSGDTAPKAPAAEAADPAARDDGPLMKRRDKPAASAEPRTYVVQPGDTLFRIAEKFYGDSTHWKKIRDANKAGIDPDGRIRAGQILVVP